MFWCKKKGPPRPQPNPELMVLRADDPMLNRAEKIWKLLGFANDRLGMISSLAGYMSAYRDLDEQVRNSNK